MKQMDNETGSRLSALCSGCPLRGFFYVMSRNNALIVYGDIGCDRANCETLPSGMAGMEGEKVFAAVSASAFVRSGLTSVAYHKGNLIPVVFDNSDTEERRFIEDALTEMGYQKVIIVDPQDLTAMQNAVDEALESEGSAAIITRRSCLRGNRDVGLCEVDVYRCLGCKKCLGVACPALSMKDGKSKIDPKLCVGCTVCAQVCPVDAILRRKM